MNKDQLTFTTNSDQRNLPPSSYPWAVSMVVGIFYLFFGSSLNAQQPYINQNPPTLHPEVFAPGLISLPNEYEFGSVFNAAATEFFYGVAIDGKEEIRYTKWVDGAWSSPVTILSHQKYGYNDPFLSPDENRLYVISKRGKGEEEVSKDYDIWYVERRAEGWSTPINAGPNINSDGHEYYISFTNNGSMYFASNKMDGNFNIYKSEWRDGAFQEAIPLPEEINTAAYEADVFVAPDESYVIFCAKRRSGLGQGDLYISFKNADGTWAQSVNMGAMINSEHHELCPFVTKDGKYFFYTSNQDIYWVSAIILERYRTE